MGYGHLLVQGAALLQGSPCRQHLSVAGCSEALSGHLQLVVCPGMPSIAVDADAGSSLTTLLCSCQHMQKAAWTTAERSNAALARLSEYSLQSFLTCLQCFDTSEALNSPLRAGTQFPHEATTKQDTPTWSKATCSYR